MWFLFKLEHVQNHLVDVDPQFWYLVGYYFVYFLRYNLGKYEVTHNIVIAGDLNGSLSSARNNNHDKLLKQFCRRHQLRHTINNTHCPTFHHHNGKSNSQIDYILENIQSNILLDTKIEDQHQLNGSAHVHRW
jgi:hypothetical protein